MLFKANEVRGCSFFYGAKAIRRFLKKNRLLSVLRAHEAQLEGYKMHHWNGKSEFPTVITVFSAPNYCDVYNNKGAILKFNVRECEGVEQYFEHPAVQLQPASLYSAQFHGYLHVEHALRVGEGD